MKNENLLTSFKTLEDARNQLLSRIEMVEHDKLNARPANNKWSIAQICHHLILSEKLSILYMQKKLHYKTNIENTKFASAIRLQLLKLYLKSPFPIKAPENVAKLPEESSVSEITREWEKVRLDLKKMIEKLPAEFLSGNIFKHPLAGKMNLYHALQFFDVHFRHHQKQISDLQ